MPEKDFDVQFHHQPAYFPPIWHTNSFFSVQIMLDGEFTGGDIFDDIVHNHSILGSKFTDLSADFTNLCKVIGQLFLFIPRSGPVIPGLVPGIFFL